MHLPCGGNATEQSRLSLTLLIRIIAVVALRCGDCDHVTVPYSTSIYTITDGARPSVPPNPVASCSTMCEQSSSLSVVEKEGMHVCLDSFSADERTLSNFSTKSEQISACGSWMSRTKKKKNAAFARLPGTNHESLQIGRASTSGRFGWSEAFFW